MGNLGCGNIQTSNIFLHFSESFTLLVEYILQCVLIHKMYILSLLKNS